MMLLGAMEIMATEMGVEMEVGRIREGCLWWMRDGGLRQMG